MSLLWPVDREAGEEDGRDGLRPLAFGRPLCRLIRSDARCRQAEEGDHTPRSCGDERPGLAGSLIGEGLRGEVVVECGDAAVETGYSVW